MGIRRLRSVRAVLAGSLVFGSVVTAWVIGDAVPASATAPTIVKCNAGGNLQTAINSALPGSTLIVHGTCTGNFTIAQNLTLQGSGTLSGTGHNGPVLTINSGTASVDNLTIENGIDTSSVGGGIFNNGALDPQEQHRVGQHCYLWRRHLEPGRADRHELHRVGQHRQRRWRWRRRHPQLQRHVGHHKQHRVG